MGVTQMDFEAIDKDMSSWVVAGKARSTILFATDIGLTDMLPRAQRFRWMDEAQSVANALNADRFCAGFNFEPVTVPAASLMKATGLVNST